MSRPKYWWYGNVVKAVRHYPAIKEDTSKQSKKYCKAIEESLEEIRMLDTGEEQIEVIDLVYFRKTMTREGAAMKVGYSDRQVQRWLNRFIYSVGHKVGF